METSVAVQCPYCGIENRFSVKAHPQRDWQVRWCDWGSKGGCDLPFVVEIEIEIAVIAHPIESITKDRRE